jgi:hypothetical protein
VRAGVGGVALPVEVKEVGADGVGSVVEESKNLKCVIRINVVLYILLV